MFESLSHIEAPWTAPQRPFRHGEVVLGCLSFVESKKNIKKQNKTETNKQKKPQ